MEKMTMKASSRETTGKGACRRLRKDGLIPGVVYKGGKQGVAVYVNTKDLWKALHTSAGENAIITLDIEGGKVPETKTVIVKDIQTHPLNDKFVHVDFQEISLTEKIRVQVPVRVKGEAAGVKEGGVLNQVLWELEVECLPADIPEHIDVNVETLQLGEAIHIKDMIIGKELHIIGDPLQVVIGVIVPQVEEEKPAEDALGPETAEPELIKKGKKEEAGEEGSGDKKSDGDSSGAKK